MAEFCPECLKKINKDDNTKIKYIVSDYCDLCDECGEWKPVVIGIKEIYPESMLKFLLRQLLRLMISPYLIYRHFRKP